MNSSVLLALLIVFVVACIGYIVYSCLKKGWNLVYVFSIAMMILAIILALKVYKSEVSSVSMFLESVQSPVSIPVTDTGTDVNATAASGSTNESMTSTELE